MTQSLKWSSEAYHTLALPVPTANRRLPPRAHVAIRTDALSRTHQARDQVARNVAEKGNSRNREGEGEKPAVGESRDSWVTVLPRKTKEAQKCSEEGQMAKQKPDKQERESRHLPVHCNETALFVGIRHRSAE